MKYKAGDYIRLIKYCNVDLIGKTVRVHSIHGEDYLIDLMNGTPCRAWVKARCEEGSELNVAMMVLHGQKMDQT